MTAHSGPRWFEEALARSGANERLAAQLRFVLELDKAKTVLRRTYLTDGSRLEDDAQHMWHALMAAIVLAEHAAERVDPIRLALMLAVHDVVEIDAGDTFIYDDAGMATKTERERLAADRIFGILPPDQQELFRQLWEEFEEHDTATARMATAIDRLLPLLMNRALDGRSWREHGVSFERVYARNSTIEQGSPALWAVGRQVLEQATTESLFGAGPGARGAPPGGEAEG